MEILNLAETPHGRHEGFRHKKFGSNLDSPSVGGI